MLPQGAIDCNVHVSVPGMKALLPYMDDAWRDMILTRAPDGLELASYPSGAPICNYLYGAQAVHSEDLAQALCRATND